jgi:hypothetical protein
VTTITEALDRLSIVRAATEDLSNPSLLASVEAFSAVTNLLEAVLDDTEGCHDCMRCRMLRVLAFNSLAHISTMPLLAAVLNQERMDQLFHVFAVTVETLVDQLQSEQEDPA